MIIIFMREELLKMGKYDDEWIGVIEKSLSNLSLDICNNRSKVIQIINEMSPTGQFSNKIRIAI